MSQETLGKFFRSLAKSPFIPNGLRISLLRRSGIRIGDDVTIGEGFTVSCNLGYEPDLTIEDRVAIGANITVILTSTFNTHPSMNVFGQVVIRHDAWIGAGVIILPDITVGNNSVIGAGAVVTKDVPPYCVVAGVPAKVINQLPPAEIETGA